MYEHHILNPLHLQESLSYEDCVTKSGIIPEIYHLNFEPASGIAVYDLLYRDTDPTTNSSSGSAQAKRNYSKCESAIGWIANGRFRQLSGPPIAFDKKSTGKWEPRRYSQPQGKPLEIFFPAVTLTVWKTVAVKASLPMPKFPVIGLAGEAIGFWDWVKASNCPITITEGEKKACCLISRGYAAIGLPGINCGYKVTERGETVTKPDGSTYQKATARKLRSELQRFDTPERTITIIFDYRAGDYSQSPEIKAASTTANLFKIAIAKIAQLPGPDKGIDDFAVIGGNVDAIVGGAFEQIPEDWQFKKWLRLRGFTADVKINSKYFDAPAPASGTVTAIRSGLGTGKTHWAGDKITSDARGLQLNLGYRNALLLQQCEKWKSSHFDEHNGWQHLKDLDARLSLCVDSLLKLPIEMFEYSVQHIKGMTVIFDEAVSIIKHALSSKTLLGKRPEILDRLEIICKLADRVVLMDGNLCDIVVDYIAKISGKQSHKIENIFTGETPPIFFVTAGKKAKKWLSAEILKSPCPAIATDSLRDAEAFAKQLKKTHGPGILLSSKTVATEAVKEFLKNPDVYIAKYKLAWIIFTPTAESGIDISIKNYFSDVFCWFVGVVDIDASVQMSRRVRHPERIIILCPERGIAAKNNTGGIFEEEIVQALADFGDIEARLLVEDESQLQQIRVDLAARIITPHTELWAKLQAKAQLERAHLREYLLKAFELAGYSVQSVTPDECDYEGHIITKEECKNIEAQEIFNAPDIELSEALEIKLNFKATWEDRCKTIKFFLKARLPGIENSDLWCWEFVRRVRFDERSLLNQLDANWIFKNQDDAAFLQRSRIVAGKREFLGDFSTRYLKLRALKSLGLEQFLESESGKVWTKNSPEVLELLQRCKQKQLSQLLGHPGKMKPIQWLNKLLNMIGSKLPAKNIKQNGVQHREYSYNPELSHPKNWTELVAFTAEKQAKKIFEIKEAEALAARELEEVAPPPIFDINIGVAATSETTSEITLTETQPKPSERMGWVSRWGKWVRASFLATTDGSYYRMLIEQVDGWTETLAPPDMIRWDS
ncbi:DUF3854 domain-containing protein [Microcoleus sp. A006_D1]|uniref:plasmid replication protein, CyRepA1 family n=1 Tax=Microcoleus sp. A006_D1 TaxID=3055267 RepID=UPI002FD2C52E